ncbi:MAG: DNA repair protein RecO [Chloroflexi bacterium]|nr:DNA repair protein RecO [Chloroflexota bacterium]
MSDLPRIYKTEAIVIQQKEIGEADRLLSLYTPSFGKLKVVAKGVRRTKSKMGGHLEVLNQCTVLLARGQSLDNVSQAQLLEPFLPLRDDLWRLSCGLYVAEMIERFAAERQANMDLYQLLQQTLHRIAAARKGDLVLRFFEMRFLDIMGYRPQLDRCVRCEEAIKAAPLAFSHASGGLVCAGCQGSLPAGQLKPVSVNAVKSLRFMQDNPFETAVRLNLNGELASELEYLLRSFLFYVLENQIRSTEWLDRLRRGTGG